MNELLETVGLSAAARHLAVRSVPPPRRKVNHVGQKNARKTAIAFQLFIALASITGWSDTAKAQTTAFTYQGRLTHAGSVANGDYDLQFGLFDSQTNGTQIGGVLTLTNVPVSNGVFTATLDYGANAFTGIVGNRFLEISVRPAGQGSYQILAPRQQITPTPYAINSINVSGPLTGADSVARLIVSNSAPGILDPSSSNVPPAALRAEATSTTNANVGLLGIADGSGGIGVLGVARGTPSGNQNGNNNVTGLLGIALSTTGKTTGIEATVFSPDGAAVKANATGGGNLFVGDGSSGDFKVDSSGSLFATGPITTEGGINGRTLYISDSGKIEGDLNITRNLVIGGSISGSTKIEGGLNITGNLVVGGSKSSVAELPDGRSVLLYAVESPENWFEDFGSEQLKRGVAWVRIDSTFAQTTEGGANYHVFLTPSGKSRGLYVAKKTASGFEVREIDNGRSDTPFDYRIVSLRRGFEKKRFEEAPAATQTR